MPAPFVVAHLQVGLLLRELEAPLAEGKNERAGIYLTNALTGWEPPDGSKPQMLLAFPELMRERNAAEKVKQAKPILVVIGNPPYNGFAGIAVAEEADLTKAYKTAQRAPQPQGQGLNDLYVRFYRMAERKIVEKGGKGIVCFISNYSWLDGLSFTGMRERYLTRFDRVWIDCLNGDKYKTGKLTPEGKPDPSIFSTEFNREGIPVGTAIALLARREKSRGAERIEFRSLWGKEKGGQLLEDAQAERTPKYEEIAPELKLGLSFQPGTIGADYLSWPLLPELFPVSFPGVKTSRDEVVVNIDRERLVARMEQYFDPELSDAEVAAIMPTAMTSTARFDARKTRRYLVRRGFKRENIVRYCYRPFDYRWLYWEPETKLLDEKREEYFPKIFDGNVFLFTTGRTRKGIAEPALAIRNLNDLNCMDSGARGFALYLNDNRGARLSESQLVSNISKSANRYLRSLAANESQLFHHLISVILATSYRSDNEHGLRTNWPRIPLPANKERLIKSAELGNAIAALLDPDLLVEGVTASKVRNELSMIGVISRENGRALDPEAGHLDVTAGWGHGGKGSAVMPGKGRIVAREYTSKEREAISAGIAELGIEEQQAFGLLGGRTVDVYLNQIAYWSNIPLRVWEYTIGGYQVIKKWLSYRERDILGRSLKMEEARAVMEMARRIAAIILLQPKLDANYESVKDNAYAWPGGDK